MVGTEPSFSLRLAAASAATDSLLCLGLDPNEAAGVQAAERHCLTLLEATAGSICAVKPNIAFFEQYGSPGYALLERLRSVIPSDTMLIIDAKRGDLDSTSAAYARALFDVLGADAITVNPLMGGDSLAPFLQRPGRCVFVLARTSNPGAMDFLESDEDEAKPALYQRIVQRALCWPAVGTVGFVVGATAPLAVSSVRRLAPDAPLLLPGLGAQGGVLSESIEAALDRSRGGVVVPVSRGISRAAEGPARAAEALRDAINRVRRQS